MTNKERISQLEMRLAQVEARMAEIERLESLRQPHQTRLPSVFMPHPSNPYPVPYPGWRSGDVWCGAVGYNNSGHTC